MDQKDEIATSLGELREICDRLWGRIVVLERRLEALEGVEDNSARRWQDWEISASFGCLRHYCDQLLARIEELEGPEIKGIGFTAPRPADNPAWMETVPEDMTWTPDPWPHTEPTQTLRDDWVIGALVDRIMREGIARDPDYTVPQVTMWDGWPGPPVETDHD